MKFWQHLNSTSYCSELTVLFDILCSMFNKHEFICAILKAVIFGRVQNPMLHLLKGHDTCIHSLHTSCVSMFGSHVSCNIQLQALTPYSNEPSSGGRRLLPEPRSKAKGKTDLGILLPFFPSSSFLPPVLSFSTTSSFLFSVLMMILSWLKFFSLVRPITVSSQSEPLHQLTSLPTDGLPIIPTT